MLPETNKELSFYEIALTYVPGVGIKTARSLIAHYGNAENIFKAPLKEIKHITGITEAKAKGFRDEDVLKQAEEQYAFALKEDVATIFFTDERYPDRLHNCSDAPMLLYYKGAANMNASKIVAIVGTRKNTEYGAKLTEDLVEQLQSLEDILVVSGLAFGIDAIAHKKAAGLGIPTIGVMGNGLDMVYPSTNKKLAGEMLENGGGLLTEFPKGTIPATTNFPMRNRIVAGMSDVTIVVESDISGGALITAHMANGYNRDVAAFPGRVTDAKSSGCNELIRANVASMITGADDLLDLMNWSKNKSKRTVQKQLFLNLTPQEQSIVDLLQTKDAVHADELYHHTKLGNSQLAATLLQLEMQGIIKALPGKNYRIS